jgi:hypothetical protein
MSKGKIGLLLGGLIFVLTGLGLAKTGFDFLHGFHVPRFVAILWVMLGIGAIVYALSPKEATSLMICPVCEEVYGRGKVPDSKCPQCGADLEILEGFYERHSEGKEVTESKPRQRDSDRVGPG